MSARPPVLRQDLVDRLRGVARAQVPAGLRERAIGMVGRPLRTVVVRLVDPSLQATLNQLRNETAVQPDPEIEILRAELATAHAALLALGRRLDDIERTLAERPPGTGP
ncbi:MAG: hypothetical protein ACR2KK_15020 [Acidimicrobiales bacterium]